MPKTRKESYRILQLPEDANEEEVKRAYKQKARELHPDKNPDDPNATKRFQDLSEAYQRIISGKRDGEELPEDFFIDPFELFINVILIRQMQQERARRRFVQVFGFEANDYDYEEEENFAYLNFEYGGFPFGSGFSRATSSRTAHGQRTFEQQARFYNQSDSYYENERRENCKWQKRPSRSSFSRKSTDSEKRSKSQKSSESKQKSDSEHVKEDVGKHFSGDENTSQNVDASVGNKKYPKAKSGTRRKNKSQQTSNAWQKGKKRNGKRGKKKQTVTIAKEQSKENFDESNEHSSEMPMNSSQDFLENKVCDKQTCGDEQERIQECHNKPTKIKMENSVSTFSSNCNFEKAKMFDDTNECQFSTNTATDKNSDVNSETSKVQAAGKENLKSVDKILPRTIKKPAERSENEYDEGSALTNGARPKVISSELTNKAKNVFTPSKSDRSCQSKKINRKKNYTNSKFQNLKELSSDFKLSGSKQADILESSDSDEKQVVQGKGFKWNKTIKPEEKTNRQKKMTKDEVLKKLSQMKSKVVDEQMNDIKSEETSGFEHSNNCDSFLRSQNSKISVEEFFGVLKCKKSKLKTVRKHRQNDNYYFGKIYVAKVKPKQTAVHKQYHKTNGNDDAAIKNYHSKKNYGANNYRQLKT